MLYKIGVHICTVMHILHSQCNGCGFICYTQHLSKSGYHNLQFFTPAPPEGLGRGGTLGKPRLTYHPDLQSPAAALLFRSGTTVQNFCLTFSYFKRQFIKLQLYTDNIFTSFSISKPYFILACFFWHLLVASHLLNTFHFMNSLVNLFYSVQSFKTKL